ncbi:exonuclease SbcCD subunit D [Actinokineospora sp. NBRC 105648]|uniref:exonuclease SbcCD subunit D n=1 Tax=Actinokineospora sp. NBRC 105648 TaxID=3032206 RepID=UPI0025532CF0|nr:exonuclease SbcCD subunit D [Actinokineospora sp. NBRC 105648]
MRVLHTSDWHVGRTFHGRDLLAEQEAVLGGLANLVSDERVDVLVVSGDLYDRAVPSAEAVEACAWILAQIAEAGAQIIITPGNHDSAPRLGAFAGFAQAGGLHLRTTIAELHKPVVLPDEHGPVAFYGIPYLEPEPARHVLGDLELRGHAAVLGEAMRRVKEDLQTRKSRSVVLAHAFVIGGETSDSERTIAVGGVPHVPGSLFDGIDYAALGHLHGPQVLAEHLRYSGSPLAYSFSEARHRKSVWLVELDESGLAGVERRELPVPRALATARGDLQELLTEPRYEDLVEKFLSVELTDPVRPIDAMRRLQERFPHAVHLDWRPEGGRPVARRYTEAVRGRSDEQVACCFVEDARKSAPTNAERALLREALAAVAGKEPE